MHRQTDKEGDRIDVTGADTDQSEPKPTKVVSAKKIAPDEGEKADLVMQKGLPTFTWIK